ncbi:hypothetical protein AW736_01640 [Termitidicoccus mucosus]|uniref:Uncharacterized protein n=1 Tax=Termitidicoccus mucosus TaxID=1184151 RepID=A0A178IPE9_9BACT|nr:hypothetical protein AW736_01640 [Opitutaceae bacterium TSB47]
MPDLRAAKARPSFRPGRNAGAFFCADIFRLQTGGNGIPYKKINASRRNDPASSHPLITSLHHQYQSGADPCPPRIFSLQPNPKS